MTNEEGIEAYETMLNALADAIRRMRLEIADLKRSNNHENAAR